MSKLKVALLINSMGSGGAERIVSSIADYLNINSSITVDLILLENVRFYKVDSNVKIYDLSNDCCEGGRVKKILSTLKQIFQLKKIISQNKYSVVQSHLFRANYVNVLSKIIGSSHSVQLVSHSSLSRFDNGGIAGFVNAWLVRYLYPRGDVNVFLTNAMKKDYERRVVFKGDNLVVNNPYDTESIAQRALLKIEGFELDDEKYIISLGRLIPLKRNLDLIDAFNLFLKKNKSYKLVFVGDGEDREALKNHVQKLGVENYILFLGIKLNPYPYIAKASLLVLASETEGFPNVLIESLVCGTAIVSTDCLSGPREILAPNTDFSITNINELEKAKYGFLVPVGAVEILADAIELMLSDKEMKSNYEMQGKVYASTFDVKLILKKYENMLNVRHL